MLQGDEIEKLRDGTLQLDCPVMVLRKSSANDTDVYEGGGYIRRTPDGDLRFRLYSARERDLTRVFRSFGVSGQLIADEEFYELSARDSRGRVWESNRILPDHDSCAGEKGVVTSGRLDIATCTQREATSSAKTRSGVKWIFFDKFSIPCHAFTEKTTSIAGHTRQKRSLRDTAVFKSCGCNFEMRAVEGIVTCSAITNSKSLPPNLEIRVVEVLRFVLARPIEWAVLEKYEGETEIIQIKRVDVHERKPSIGRPIASKAPSDSRFVWELFDKYLSYVLNYTETDRYSPVSTFVYKVIKASEGSIDGLALVLAVAVEGVLEEAFPDLAHLSEEEIDKLKAAQQIVDKTPLDMGLKKRIKTVLGQWVHPSTTDKLTEFVKAGTIKASEYEAWKKLRHPFVHGSLPEIERIGELVNLCYLTTMLLYKLIFRAIGYESSYTDYGAPGWPLVGKKE